MGLSLAGPGIGLESWFDSWLLWNCGRMLRYLDDLTLSISEQFKEIDESNLCEIIKQTAVKDYWRWYSTNDETKGWARVVGLQEFPLFNSYKNLIKSPSYLAVINFRGENKWETRVTEVSKIWWVVILRRAFPLTSRTTYSTTNFLIVHKWNVNIT